MGIFTRKQEVNSELRNFIKKIEKWKNISLEDVKDSDDVFKITLREKKPFPRRDCPRLFVLSGSHKKETYSITSFEIHNSRNTPEFSQIYKSKVEGNDDVMTILTELKEIIHGKDIIKTNPNFPF